jgi:hypothetical protein
MDPELNLFSRYHNTTDLSGETLDKKEAKALTQDDKVLAFFSQNPGENFTPYEVWKYMNLYNVPITSIRRAISNLTKAGYLVKTSIKRAGQYGELNFAWTLKINE